MATRPLPPPLPSPARGFTLVEVAVTAAIATLLASIALPAFRDQLLRSHRHEATQALQRTQSAQESYRSLHGAYAESLTALPVPPLTPGGHYQVELRSQGPDAYTVVARAQGRQAQDAECAEVTLRVQGTISRQEPSGRCWPA